MSIIISFVFFKYLTSANIFQEILTRRANAQIVSLAMSTRDTPRDIINGVLGDETDAVNENIVSDASLRRKLVDLTCALVCMVEAKILLFA